jgi:hypothetical protein
MSKIKFITLVATFGLAMAFTLSCSSGGGGDDDDTQSASSNSYYVSSYGISDGVTCQYLDELILGNSGNMTEDDFEGKGYSFADVKGIWDTYRLDLFGKSYYIQV